MQLAPGLNTDSKITMHHMTLTLTSSTKFPDTSLLSSWSSSVAAWALFCKICTTSFRMCHTCKVFLIETPTQICLPSQCCCYWEKSCRKRSQHDQVFFRSIFYTVLSGIFIYTSQCIP